MEEKQVRSQEQQNSLSPFKQMLREDIAIFLNIEEFGERITLNGEDYIGVIEHSEKDFNFTEEGLAQAVTITLYLEDCTDFKKFKTGKAIKVNYSDYIINDTYTEEGIRIFKLGETRGY